jgi:S1-C subfamily serine protease
MRARNLAILVFPVLAAASLSLGAADGPDDLAQALALEKQMEKIIAQAEESIACILVSRSEAYRKAYPPSVPDETPALTKSFESCRRAGELGHPDNLTDDQRKKLKDLNEDQRKKIDLSDTAAVPESFGSGIVIDKDKGLILTNYHVVRDAVLVYVRLPGGKAGGYADIHAADPRSDLAVLKVKSEVTSHIVRPIPFGDADKLRRGQFVLSLANPYAAGFRDGQPSASWGILSNIRRRAPKLLREEERVKSLHHYGTLLQMDARLNLGCSGGALLNLHGELIGLTTSYAAIHGYDTPGGFAVPIDACFRRILDVLKAGEEVEYGFLGVRWNVGEAAQGNGNGVKIGKAIKGSPADRAGLAAGDVICDVGGVKVHDFDDLFLYLGTQLAGTEVQLLVKKNDRDPPRMVKVTLAKMHIPGKGIFSACEKIRPFDKRGMRVEYSSMLIRSFEAIVESLPIGVLVDEVKPNSPAAQTGLRPGEVIRRVNGDEVSNPAEYKQRIDRAGAGPIQLTVSGVDPGDAVRTVILR